MGRITKKELSQSLKEQIDMIDMPISTRQADWGATATHASRIDAAISTRASQASIGANTDAAGTITVFARLKQIYDYLASVLSSTRAAKIDSIDATVSSRASQASVNTISTNVGSNADAASASGSLHAKLKDMKSAISQSDDYYPNTSFSFGSANNSWSTIFNVSGEGILNLDVGGSVLNDTELRITIDGGSAVSSKPVNQLTADSSATARESTFRRVITELKFKTSLLVELKAGKVSGFLKLK